MLYHLILDSEYVAAVGALLATLLCFYMVGRYLEPRSHPLEPPYSRAAIPLVGHMIGLVRNGNTYLGKLTRNKEIRTVNFGWKRAYIIGSLDLMAAVQRQSATISFSPVVKMMAECLSQYEPDLAKLFDSDDSRVENRIGLSHDTLSSYHRAFRSGAGSEHVQMEMLQELLRLMCVPVQSDVQQQNLDLYPWLKHIVTQAAMKSIYGPRHPFDDPVVEKAFWDFKLECGPLLFGFAPYFLAPKAMKARAILDEAFTKYYTNGALDEASELAWARYSPPASYGIKSHDIARLESPFLFAVLATTAPACFWALIEIQRRPSLLVELRNELSQAITVGDPLAEGEKTAPTRFIVRMECLKKSCPLILSVYQETLRRLSIFSLFRVVLKDTMLDDRYLLKAGSLVLLPNHAVHNSSNVWGTDATVFNPYRFMPGRKRIPPSHFRTFGDAPFRCPGRHFATTEIMAILCLIVMRFDLEPRIKEDETGGWNLPLPSLGGFGAILPPKDDVGVKLRPRDGWQGHWSFELGDPQAKFPLVIG